jgi:hypothetical protein
MNKNNNSQSQSENKRSLPQSPKTPTSTTSATTSKKTKYFISPNRYSALAETDLVTTDTANVNNNNQNDFDAQNQGSHYSTTHRYIKEKRFATTNIH